MLAASLSLNVVAQNKKKSAKDDHGHTHDEEAPHGGTVVKLGKPALNLEWVRDPDTGSFQVFVLDGHMEYVRVPEKSFELVAKVNGKEEKVTLSRKAANEEASEMFEGKADWIKTAKKFQGTIPQITLKGQSFTNVTFAFPKSASKAHAH